MWNQFKTVILLGLMTALLLWVGSFWGQNGLIIALAFAMLLNIGSFWFSDRIVLRLYRAKEVTDKNSKLYTIVKEISQKAAIPMPKVYIVPGNFANAFATGRSPKHAAVAATQGILDLLDEGELKGVIAHEIAHIKNRDTLIATVAATIASVISFIAMMARFAALFGGYGGRDRDRGGSGLELLVLAILTPLIATVIQLAISRSREYLADATGAKILRNPSGLADALLKLDKNVAHHPLGVSSSTEATAHLFISPPFSFKGFLTLFSTHPRTEERVRKLRAMIL
ncbi:zinc metalloprotease HtpX [Candidatus Woesearchaeota archaeon]|nr:zinc metalloprotease HtpX [Candidatus Woesearchaeota archaeon]